MGRKAHFSSSLWQELDGRARRLGVLDTKLAQGAAIFLALVVVKLIPQIMNLSIWWFVLLTVLCAIKPLMTFLAANADSP